LKRLRRLELNQYLNEDGDQGEILLCNL